MPPRKRRVTKRNPAEDGDDDVKAGVTPVPAETFTEPDDDQITKPKTKSGRAKKTASAAPPPPAPSPSSQPPSTHLVLLLLVLGLVGAGSLHDWKQGGNDLIGSLVHKIAGLFGGHQTKEEPRGFFPSGCRWREVNAQKVVDRWDVRQYEYWDEANERWSQHKPDACDLPPQPFPRGYPRDDGRTYQQCGPSHCVYHNLWYNDGNWYRLADVKDKQNWQQVARDVHLQQLRVKDPAEFVKNLDASFVHGDTFVLDFVYFLHPTAIGHWLEHLTPLFSLLEAAIAPRPQRVVLLHLKRVHVFEWARAVLAVALGIDKAGDLPPIYFQEEVNSVWTQIGTKLEGIPPSAWVCFERALMLKDTFNYGNRTASSHEYARLFRTKAYELHAMDPPDVVPGNGNVPLPPPPKVITYQRKSANRRVINEQEMVELLKEFGEVRVVEFDASTPFEEQLSTMATTGVFVSVHTSNLANAYFLPPGAAVVELIQRNWVWPSLDNSFKVQTRSLGDIHHFAWRSRKAEPGIYINPRDEKRFGGKDWAGTKCDTEECVEAHTNVDVIVDLDELRRLLNNRLPLVFEGKSIEEVRLPWPPRD